MNSNSRVQLLPTPMGLPRVETGAVQFGDDWPGLFIRGDNAYFLMLWIRRLAELLAHHPDPDVADILWRLTEYADMIEKDVILGPTE
jgi:hypothetical protein